MTNATFASAAGGAAAIGAPPALIFATENPERIRLM
jgi:hypothetical protein